ncbi:nucleotidyltransferase family protein [Microbacterium sp.]|uniref:nucleotidyltransferase family protein n=1 Tax=Microbacterium sp. TaxID=51671 RepID=UPI003F9E6A82
MTDWGTPAVCGIVLAAGAGSRYGGPKALARTADGRSWARLAVDLLERAGCDDILVAVGAESAAAERVVPPRARAVRVPDWDSGLSASLRGALAAAADTHAPAALVIPVDTPAMPAAVCARVLAAADPSPSALARAVFGGTPGHPVLLGRDHWEQVAATLVGDTGAAGYLREHRAARIECGDIWDGADVDVR